jgi:DNA-binding Xre family transcriptional regulator
VKKVTNTQLFLKILKEKNMKQKELAAAIGISRQSMSYKINNNREFVPSEIEKICSILGITDLEQRQAIFFAV